MTNLSEDELKEILSEAFEALYQRVNRIALDSPIPEDIERASLRNKYYVQAHDRIVALINRGKPKVSEEFIEEKANIIADMITDYSLGGHRQKKPIEMDELQYFIRSLVEEK